MPASFIGDDGSLRIARRCYSKGWSVGRQDAAMGCLREASAALGDLGSSAERVRAETAMQGSFSSDVRASMSTLSECSLAVREAAADILLKR